MLLTLGRWSVSTVLEPSTVLKPSPVIQEAVRSPRPAARNVAVDAYRGFVMLLMMGEVLRFSRVAEAFPTSWFWKVLAYNQTHVEWAGCSPRRTSCKPESCWRSC